MSLVYITHHNENIYDVDGPPDDTSDISSLRSGNKQKQSAKQKPLRSATKYGQWIRAKLDVEYKKQQIIDQGNGEKIVTSAKKARHRTMGCAKTPINPPCDYLRKNKGVKWRRENEHVCPPPRGLPPIPPAGNKKTDPKTNSDFVRLNVEKVKEVKSRRGPPRYVDTPVGTRHNLINSGLIPQYICRKDFGKVPGYLSHHKEMLRQWRAQCMPVPLTAACGDIERAQAMGMSSYEMAGVRKMLPEERTEILDGLKKYLTDLTKQYQSMSLHTDTASKKLRKGKLETDLRQVEQDILLLDTSPIIYVSDY